MSRFLTGSLSQLTPYTPGEQPQDRKYIKLNTNESPYPPSPEVISAISGRRARELRLYPDPELRELKSAISQQYVVGDDMIFCCNGSDEVLSFAFLAWGSQGVAFADVTYGFYPVFARLYGIDTQIIPLNEDFTLDPALYEGCGRMVVIANPNAPTGLAIPAESIGRIAESNPGSVVVVDEAYVDFGGETALPLVDEYKNVLVVRTYSKSRQLAGARLGYAMGDPALIADLKLIKYSFNPYNVNRLTSLAGTLAMRDTEWFERTRGKTIATRAHITDELRALGFTVTDSKANFVFAFHPAVSGKEYYRRLKEKGILVRHFDAERISDYVRITVGTDREMKIFLSKTKEILSEAMS